MLLWYWNKSDQGRGFSCPPPYKPTRPQSPTPPHPPPAIDLQLCLIRCREIPVRQLPSDVLGGPWHHPGAPHLHSHSLHSLAYLNSLPTGTCITASCSRCKPYTILLSYAIKPPIALYMSQAFEFVNSRFYFNSLPTCTCITASCSGCKPYTILLGYAIKPPITLYMP